MNKITVTIKQPNTLNAKIQNYKVIERGGVSDYNDLTGKPTLNGAEIIGDKTAEDYGITADSILPTGGYSGDILTKRTDGIGIAWVTPANDLNGDNTRPITASAVQTIVGNIDALLATI